VTLSALDDVLRTASSAAARGYELPKWAERLLLNA